MCAQSRSNACSLSVPRASRRRVVLLQSSPFVQLLRSQCVVFLQRSPSSAEILDVCMDTVHAMLYEPSLGAACNLGRLYVAIKRLETVQYYHTLYLDWWQRRDWQDNQDRQLMQELRMDSDYDDSSENSPRWGFEIDSDGNWHDIPPSSPSMSW